MKRKFNNYIHDENINDRKKTIMRMIIQIIGLTQLLERYINEAFAKRYIQYPFVATANKPKKKKGLLR